MGEFGLERRPVPPGRRGGRGSPSPPPGRASSGVEVELQRLRAPGAYTDPANIWTAGVAGPAGTSGGGGPEMLVVTSHRRWRRAGRKVPQDHGPRTAACGQAQHANRPFQGAAARRLARPAWAHRPGECDRRRRAGGLTSAHLWVATDAPVTQMYANRPFRAPNKVDWRTFGPLALRLRQTCARRHRGTPATQLPTRSGPMLARPPLATDAPLLATAAHHGAAVRGHS
jgi:hypothetical protein